jgi:hypothetical protein
MRILWRSNSSEKIKEYRMKTVNYGTASGPDSAARCMKQLSMDYAEKFPTAAIAIGYNFYVDDLIVSVSTIEEGIHLQKDLNILVKESGLELGQWDSAVLRIRVLKSMMTNSCPRLEESLSTP